VTRSVIPRLEPGEETRRVSDEEKLKIKVTGSVSAYRPIPKPEKGASLLPHGGGSTAAASRRAMASIVRTEGGAKRVPGPFGMDVSGPGRRRLT